MLNGGSLILGGGLKELETNISADTRVIFLLLIHSPFFQKFSNIFCFGLDFYFLMALVELLGDDSW